MSRYNKTGLWTALVANIAGALVSSYYGNTFFAITCIFVVGWLLWDLRIAYSSLAQ